MTNETTISQGVVIEANLPIGRSLRNWYRKTVREKLIYWAERHQVEHRIINPRKFTWRIEHHELGVRVEATWEKYVCYDS